MALTYDQLLGLSNPGFSYAPLFHNIVQQQLQQLGGANTQPQATIPPSHPMSMQAIQPQLDRLTGQANNALYGGLLGYNQNLPMQSGGQNPQTFAAPQGNFRDAFAGMQGLLGGNR